MRVAPILKSEKFQKEDEWRGYFQTPRACSGATACLAQSQLAAGDAGLGCDCLFTGIQVVRAWEMARKFSI